MYLWKILLTLPIFYNGKVVIIFHFALKKKMHSYCCEHPLLSLGGRQASRRGLWTYTLQYFVLGMHDIILPVNHRWGLFLLVRKVHCTSLLAHCKNLIDFVQLPQLVKTNTGKPRKLCLIIECIEITTSPSFCDNF